MNTVERLKEVLENKLRRDISKDEIPVESILLDKTEIDESLINLNQIDYFEGLIETESASYTDTEGNYYLLIQIGIGEVEPYEIWMVNDEVKKDFQSK